METPKRIEKETPRVNSRIFPLWTVLVFLLEVVTGRAEVTGENWPGFRGEGSGLSADRNLPLHWSATDNVRWKTEVPGEGWSSPIVWANRLFLTAGTTDGKSRLVLCYAADTGQLQWQKQFDLTELPKLYPATGQAPSTPVTDGKYVYAFFEGLGLVAVDFAGNEIWKKPLGPFSNMHSEGTSPVLYRDSVILCCDQQKGGFIAAFATATGTQRWSTPRNLGSHWSTPLLINYQGKPQVVVNARTVVSYDPETGRELWSCRGQSPNVAPSPVYADNLVWAASGRNGPAMAIDPGGQGDVSETAVRMYYPTGGPYVPSPLVYPLLMLPGDDGQVRFLDRRGTVAAEVRLKGHFYASPIGAAKRIYWTSQAGETYVLDVSRLTALPPAVTVMAVNPLGEKCNASPAVSHGRLYLRGFKHLFCLAGNAAGVTPTVAAGPPPTFMELERIWKEHPAADGPDVAVRIQAVEAMAALHDEPVVPFLEQAMLKDPHWDVCEAAAKALVKQGDAAVPALRARLADRRPFIRIIAAHGLGQKADTAAVPALVKMEQEKDALSRLTALRALGEILRANPETAADALPALLAGLHDVEAVVRAGAVEALGRAQVLPDEAQTQVIQALQNALADRSPLVTAAAKRALLESYPASKNSFSGKQ
jgi:outer membrane protein assembly factor BamB